MTLKSRFVYKRHPLVLFAIAIVICSFEGIVIANAEIGDMLIDGEKKELSSGEAWDLREGYLLTVTIERDSAEFSLLKDGINVKREKVKAGESFFYFKKINFDNYKLISIPSFTIKHNKIQFHLYQYSEGVKPAAVKSYTAPRVSDKLPSIPDILKKAKAYAVLFDSDPGFMDSVSLGHDTYYVVSYSNPLPYAGGVEVLSSNGTKISDESRIEQIFTSIAWKEASAQLNASEIQILDNNDSPLGLIMDELKMWEKFSLSTVKDISDTFPSLDQLKKGNDTSARFQNVVSQKISDFETMQSITIQRNARFNPVGSIFMSQGEGQKAVQPSKSASLRKSELKEMWKTRQNMERLCKVLGEGCA